MKHVLYYAKGVSVSLRPSLSHMIRKQHIRLTVKKKNSIVEDGLEGCESRHSKFQEQYKKSQGAAGVKKK